uniref:ORF75 n=1 Tax=Nitrosopumilaceae spindle-shaped virus TaxID=3065433 RepID=A0AAT9JFP8_9VIRU
MPFVPNWTTTIEICVAMGGLLMAAIMSHKKRLARKYKEQQDKKNKPKDEPTSTS